MMVWMRLQLEWSVNPNYAFGWAVPVMAVFLWIGRERDVANQMPGGFVANGAISGRLIRITCLVGLLVLIVLLPLRIISEANPAWRGSQWALAGSAWLASLALLAAFRGTTGLKTFFAVCTFPFVAVPMIFAWESAIILFLSKWNTVLCAEILQYLGIPAIASGTILRVGATSLNIEEACSGIRSLHLSVAVAFFWCIHYRLPWKAWIAVGVSSISIAFVFNIARNTTLAFLVNSGGEQAFDRYHEVAGWCAQFAVVAAIWTVVNCLQPRGRTGRVPLATSRMDDARNSTATILPDKVLPAFTLAIVLWIAMIKLATEWWFQGNEASVSGTALQWSIASDADLKDQQIIPGNLEKETTLSLRADEARVLTWFNAARLPRKFYFLRWSPERTSKYGVLVHSPETCLTAVGMKLAKPAMPVEFEIDSVGDGFHLPFTVSEFIQNGRPVSVFYCIWDDRTGPVRSEKDNPLAYRALLTAAWRGERQTGQRVVEIAIWGEEGNEKSRESAERELKVILPTIIRGSAKSSQRESQKK
ncbi:MAG: exosortase/archaeosortase family protein [Verrucomicrobiales bacterium]|jgi:exosortase/archaeosortase family protein